MSKSEAGKLGQQKSLVAQQNQKAERIKKYNEHPNYCKQCGKPLPYNKRRNTFCSQSCSASFNNKGVRRHGTSQLHNCPFCGKPTIKNKYCSTECQKKHQQNIKVQQWKSGKISGVVGTSTSKFIRTYMLEKAQYKCQRCGWCEENPYSHSIPLELHHKDGDYTNNKEDNLEILCPNCHSLTKTYKNTGNRSSKRQR